MLAGTGPVGLRAGRLLACQGAEVRLGSRSSERAQQAAESIAIQVESAQVVGVCTASDKETALAAADVDVIIAAGAAGIQLISKAIWSHCENLKILVDLNAVPPMGIEGVEMMDKAKEMDGRVVYGAIGVGGTKMKIHKAAIACLLYTSDAADE